MNKSKPVTSDFARFCITTLIRIVVVALIVILAIVIPGFDTIMELLGSALAFSICIIFPVTFHLKLFNDELGFEEKVFNWSLIIFCSIMAIVSTVWVFLPDEVLQALDGEQG